MRTSIVVAMLLLLISGYATTAGAESCATSSHWRSRWTPSAVKNAGGNMTVTRPWLKRST